MGMIKTQIQVRKNCFVKSAASPSGVSGPCSAELLLQVYPKPPEKQPTKWTPPTSGQVGWKGLSAAQFRDAAFADADPRLA